MTRFGKKPIYETSVCNWSVAVGAYSASCKNEVSLTSPIRKSKQTKETFWQISVNIQRTTILSSRVA